jgi:hypothetical protein
MDSITFEVEDVTIQLVGGRVLIWNGVPNKEADIDLPIEVLRKALSAADMLVKSEKVKS